MYILFKQKFPVGIQKKYHLFNAQKKIFPDQSGASPSAI